MIEEVEDPDIFGREEGGGAPTGIEEESNLISLKTKLHINEENPTLKSANESGQEILNLSFMV